MQTDLCNWMSNMYDILKLKPINTIIMPGSHDSGAYVVNFKDSFIWNNNIVTKIKPFRNISCVTNLITNWTKCHKGTIYNQLCNGMRIFDLRVSYDSNNKIFYITHTFTCVNMIDVINDIKKFMNLYPKEIVIICCKPDWENRGTMYNVPDDFLNYITSNLNNYLYDNIGSFPTYEDMISANKRLIFAYSYASNEMIWNDILFNLPWTNTSNVDAKLTGLENSINSFQKGYCNVLDFILTPQTSDIVKSVFACGCCSQNNTLYGLAQKINKQLDKFVSTNKDKFGLTSGFFFDYPNTDIINSVIDLNKN